MENIIKYSELNEQDREFVDTVHLLFETDRPRFLAVFAITMCMRSDNESEKYPTAHKAFLDATEEELLKAIDSLGDIRPSCNGRQAERLDAAVNYIRRRWLGEVTV